MTAYVACPPHVRSVDVGTAIVVVDTLSGQVDTLLGWGHDMWVELARAADVAAAAEASGTSAARATELVDGLTRRRLVRLSDVPRPWTVPTVVPTIPSWGTDEAPAAVAPPANTSIRQTVLAGFALIAVLAVRAGGRRSRSFSRLVTMATAANRFARRQAERTTAERVVRSVRNAAAMLPFRIACLEESASVVLLLAVTGRTVAWHHGVAADPIRLHAWVALENVPVGEPPSTARYTSFLRIPAHRPDFEQTKDSREY